jgi:hypothetical protein
MDQQTRRIASERPPQTQAPRAADEPDSSLLDQVHAWGRAARAAREDCARGAEALAELEARTQLSAQ